MPRGACMIFRAEPTQPAKRNNRARTLQPATNRQILHTETEPIRMRRCYFASSPSLPALSGTRSVFWMNAVR
jgi:hypothetical protein